jgi:glycosyltransferase involved in cell wall biosynthesis
VSEGTSSSVRTSEAPRPATDLLLSVVVPVFNQESAIEDNVATIRESIAAGLDAPFELIVVSDGSIDGTAERVLETAAENVRVIHYDRNLGKGYAIKVGALEAQGRYVAYIDADLDLDPGWLPRYVARAEEAGLDFAIGSKRHPDSQVHYPRSRVVYSWLYQQLVRVLFRLDVRDTQVGLKVFRREVADQVLPLLLVKRFAFDLELLAVARALGFRRIEELPIRLDYRFTGSEVKPLAVAHALVDTAAIFYRLWILRYYQRQRTLRGAFGWTRPRGFEPLVSVLTFDPEALAGVDYSHVEVLALTDARPSALRELAQRARGSVLALLEEGGRPAGNWISATVPFLRREDVAAVVVAKVAPHEGSLRSRAAAASGESRLGGGSLYFRFTPGNLRYVDDFPGGSVVVEKERYLALGEAVTPHDLAARLTASGGYVLYTPETFVVGAAPPLFRPHLGLTFAYGRRRGGEVRRRGLRALRRTTLLPAALVGFLFLGPFALLVGGPLQTVWVVAALAYVASVVLGAVSAAFSSRKLAVGALVALGLVLTHVTYAAGFLRGLSAR